MRDASLHDSPAIATSLHFIAHGERTHPAFASRHVSEVERRYAAESVAPKHGTCASALDGELPDRGIERRHAHAGHSVATIAIAECLTEQLVERADLRRDNRHGA